MADAVQPDSGPLLRKGTFNFLVVQVRAEETEVAQRLIAMVLEAIGVNRGEILSRFASVIVGTFGFPHVEAADDVMRLEQSIQMLMVKANGDVRIVQGTADGLAGFFHGRGFGRQGFICSKLQQAIKDVQLLEFGEIVRC